MAKAWTGRTRRGVANDKRMYASLIGAPMAGPDGWPYLWIGKKQGGNVEFVGALSWGQLCRLADMINEARAAVELS